MSDIIDKLRMPESSGYACLFFLSFAIYRLILLLLSLNTSVFFFFSSSCCALSLSLSLWTTIRHNSISRLYRISSLYTNNHVYIHVYIESKSDVYTSLYILSNTYKYIPFSICPLFYLRNILRIVLMHIYLLV